MAAKKVKANYVDGYVIPLQKKNVNIYRRMAKIGCKFWMKHGAVSYTETIIEDAQSKFGMPFGKLLKLKKGEVAVFSYIEFKSRRHRDSVNAKVMKDMASDKSMEKMMKGPMPFDMKKMCYGGFKIIVNA